MPSEHQRILVVDDDEGGRYAVARVLRHAGFEIREAGTGQEALQRIVDERFDLVLLDMRLPDMKGVEVCRRIKSSPGASIMVLQMSASMVDASSRVAALEGGADGYITSPIEPTVLVATVRSLLRMRVAESALQSAALEWQSTFDSIRDGVALLDGNGAVRRSNATLQRILGLESGDIVGRGLDTLIPPAANEPLLVEALRSVHRANVERTLGERTFSVVIDPILDSGNVLRGGVAIVTNITERKLLDEQLRHSQKLESIGLLAGGVAHDFNNMLTGILGNASLALDSEDSTDTRLLLRDVVRAAERAAELTQQLLAYAGKGRFTVGPIDLSVLIQDLVPLIRSSVPRKVNLELDLSRSMPPIQVDKTQIEQLVMNLIINAGEAIQDEVGSVIVRTSIRSFGAEELASFLTEHKADGTYIALQVRDTGCGIDAETLKRIFDPFFSTKFLGRGLGLSAALGIIRGHKGAMKVTSEPGKGTTFEVLFPISAEAAVLAQRRQVPAATHDWETILVVDDESIVRNMLQKALTHAGYNVLFAENGAEAVSIFSRPNRISLVVLDLVMPVMSGEEALPQLLAIRPDLPVIVSSGQNEVECIHKLGESRVSGFLQKPYLPSVLIAKVRAVLGRVAVGRP